MKGRFRVLDDLPDEYQVKEIEAPETSSPPGKNLFKRFRVSPDSAIKTGKEGLSGFPTLPHFCKGEDNHKLDTKCVSGPKTDKRGRIIPYTYIGGDGFLKFKQEKEFAEKNKSFIGATSMAKNLRRWQADAEIEALAEFQLDESQRAQTIPENPANQLQNQASGGTSQVQSRQGPRVDIYKQKKQRKMKLKSYQIED